MCRKSEKPRIAWIAPQNEGVPVGSKVVQVKGLMLLWQHKSEKHRPAKPFGGFRSDITFWPKSQFVMLVSERNKENRAFAELLLHTGVKSAERSQL
jgi:hypothetical protein